MTVSVAVVAEKSLKFFQIRTPEISLEFPGFCLLFGEESSMIKKKQKEGFLHEKVSGIIPGLRYRSEPLRL